jgi:mannose-1-phosphate guanylyltransferase
MQSVILAGGLGTRLKSVLGDVPKPMAPVLGKPFLEYQLLALKRSGIREVLLCVSHRSEVIRAYFGDGTRWGVRITYSVEPEPRGTAGGLKYAEPLLPDAFLILNGDTYVELDYLDLTQYHRAKGAMTTLVLTRVPDAREGGRIDLQSDGRVVAFREKTAAQSEDTPPWINAGVYVFQRTVLNYIPTNRPVSLETETFPTLLEKGEPVYGYQGSGYFIDIGTPEKYRRFEQDLREGRVYVDS